MYGGEIQQGKAFAYESRAFLELIRYLNLAISKFLFETSEHDSALVFGKFLTLVTHHLLNIQFFSRSVLSGFHGTNIRNIRTLGYSQHGSPIPAFTIHQFVFLVALIILKGL